MKILFLALAVVAISVTSASADLVVFTTDFESDTVGDLPAGFLHVGGTGSSTAVAAGQVLELKSRSNNGNYAFGTFDGTTITDPGFGAVTTFSFDATFLDANTQQLRLRARDSGFAGGATDTVRFDLNQAAVTVGTSALYQYVVNNSTSAATAPVVGGSIAAGTHAIYQNSILLTSGANFTAADDLAVERLTLWTQGTTATSAQGTVQIDNFTVTTSAAAVPEPSSIALLGLVGLAGVVRRKRA